MDLSTLPAWAQIFAMAIAHFVAALIPFLQRQSPLYWPFLISTLVVGAVGWRFTRWARGPTEGSGWRAFRRHLLGRTLWWHPSARADYRYYLVNAVIYPLIAGPALFTGASLGRVLDWAASPAIGAPGSLAAPGLLLRIIYTLLFFVAYDFGRFVAHSLQHDVPWLWQFHKVHHSAEVLTPLTAFRVHPLDLAIMFWGGTLATGFLTWLFQRATGTGISDFTFLGLNAILWASNLVGNLNHWQIRISYGPLDRWLISPAHHQLHHSAAPQHFGVNRGFQLAVWDRLFGTLWLPRLSEEFRFGLGDGSDGEWHRVGRLYLRPFRLCLNMIAGSRPATAPASEGS